MKARIYLSCRRTDATAWSQIIQDRLTPHVGADSVLRDIDGAPAGGGARPNLAAQVIDCDVALTLIGPRWLDLMQARAERGEPDLVAYGLETAFSAGVPVIPVLVDDAALPSHDALPEAIADLAGLVPAALDIDRLDADIAALVQMIETRLTAARPQAAPEMRAAPREARPILTLRPLEEFRDPMRSDGEGPEMIAIPAGQFMMGSPETEPGRSSNEGPQHAVSVPGFALGKYAVTMAEYDRFAEATGRQTPEDEGWGRGRQPAINVAFADVLAYCAWLSEETGETYRLPSEAEWEYACRAGSDTAFWWGDTITPDRANYWCEEVYEGGGAPGAYRGRPISVDAFEPNPWRLHQMLGNVHEWCLDTNSAGYEGAPTDGSARVEPGPPDPVIRGGAWDCTPSGVRSASRCGFDPEIESDLNGFRVARVLRS